jgi:hypothetical protein
MILFLTHLNVLKIYLSNMKMYFQMKFNRNLRSTLTLHGVVGMVNMYQYWPDVMDTSNVQINKTNLIVKVYNIFWHISSTYKWYIESIDETKCVFLFSVFSLYFFITAVKHIIRVFTGVLLYHILLNSVNSSYS